MTSLDKKGVTVSALGMQAQSARNSAPKYSLAKSGRDHRANIFITEEHIRCSRLGRESPIGGAIYELKSTLGGHSHVFGSGKQTDLPLPKGDREDLSTNDALQVDVDSQPFKYRRETEVIIGTEPRGKLKDATLMKNHAVAFYGRQSPGPAAIGEKYGPSFEITKKIIAPARSFRPKLAGQMKWMQVSDTPLDVGPGIYPRKDIAIGPQYLTKRRNQNVHAFPLAPKFPKTRSADIVSQYDAAKSCFGKQVLCKNKSEPSINFNADSRDSRSKSMVCYTSLDIGPKATMPKVCFSMPQLPSERAVMGGGLG